MESTYSQVAKIIKESNNIVFFGGAGVSTECGIPDFRSDDGIYNQKHKFNFSPETILSHSFFNKNPEIFYEFLRDKMMIDNVLPHKGHRALADLEKLGKLRAVITQNIDNLHQLAGSQNVLELHGSLARFYCSKCSKSYSPDYAKKSHGVPECECGGIIRPDVVLYEESLDEDILTGAINYISNAEVLIVAGTSLAVYPAAGLLRYFRGNKIIFINKDATQYDNIADIIINKPFGKTMMKIMIELGVWNIKSEIIEDYKDNYIAHPTFKNVDISPVLNSDKNLGIRSQYARLKPSGEIQPHTHDVVEVFTVLEGHPLIFIDGDWIKIEKGSTVIAYPGEIHGVRNNSSEDVVLICNFKC